MPQPGDLSPDGQWRYDGKGWIPVPPPHSDWVIGLLVSIVAAIVASVLGVLAFVFHWIPLIGGF
jgi:hypothetical protein